MPQPRLPAKTALQAITACQKTSLQEIPSQVIMPAQGDIIVLLKLVWTGSHVPVEPSVTKQLLAWWHSVRIAQEASTVANFMLLNQLVTAMEVSTVSQVLTSQILRILWMEHHYLVTAPFWDCIRVSMLHSLYSVLFWYTSNSLFGTLIIVVLPKVLVFFIFIFSCG